MRMPLKPFIFALLLHAPLVAAEDLDARLAWSQRVELGTLVSGVVDQLPVRVGQRVSGGQLLLSLDGRPFHIALGQAEAAVASAEVLLAEAQREDDRATELYDRTVLSNHERELARIGLAEADAAARTARAHLQQVRLDQERSHIKAPFDAWVLQLHAAPGQVVVSELQSQPLLVLAQAGRMLAQAEVGASRAATLTDKSRYSVAIGGDWYDARLVSVGLEPSRQDEREVYYPLQVSFEVPAGKRLRAGQRVVLRISE